MFLRHGEAFCRSPPPRRTQAYRMHLLSEENAPLHQTLDFAIAFANIQDIIALFHHLAVPLGCLRHS